MKKMLKGLAGFAIVLALVVGVVGTVFANESKSGDVTIATDEPNYVAIDEEASQQQSVDDGWTPLTTAQAATMIGGGVTADQLSIVWQKVIVAEIIPATISFTYDGYKAGQTLYVFHNSWKPAGEGADAWDGPVANAQDKTVTATFADLSPVALVVYTPSGASDETSPKTGETNALLFIALAEIAMGSVTAVVVSKKKA